MGKYKPSEYYLESIQAGINFHEKNKAWSGTDCKRYVQQIRYLVKKYNIKTLLDYGCGKGKQYPNFADLIGLKPEDCYLYDPCIKGLDVLPQAGRQFDAIILIQAIGNIPCIDLETWVKELFETTAIKFIFFGEFDPMFQKRVKPIKPKKLKGYKKKYFPRGGYCNNIDNTKYWTELYKKSSFNGPANIYFYFQSARDCKYPLTLNANKWWDEDINKEIY